MSKSKNLGQVSGLFIGLSAPENTGLIWYDSTPNQKCHKVYDATKKMWVALNPQIVASTTYSELVNNAKKNGLSVGKFYLITDKSDTLAIAIASTKVQYVDGIGNLLVDDLGTNIQYHVSSDNLLIDDLGGVWNSSTNKLIFQFTESTPNNSTDYLLGKARSGNKWVLAKFHLSKFLSSVSGNSLAWNGGLFFSFKNAIASVLDKEGGVVSKSIYDKNLATLQNSLNSISKENQTIIKNTNVAISNSTTDDAIFEKKNTKDIDTATAPGDVLKGDTLFTIVSKFQRWINRFKYATGIQLSRLYSDATKKQFINNNDTVESAFGKVQYILKNPIEVYALPEGWTDDATNWKTGDLPKAGESFNVVFRKISNFLRNAIDVIKLKGDFAPYDYQEDIALPTSNDELTTAFQKIVGKFNQIGNITNGVIKSKNLTNGVMTGSIDLKNGELSFNEGVMVTSPYQIELSKKNGLSIQSNGNANLVFEVTPKTLVHKTDDKSGWFIGGSRVIDASGNSVDTGAAFLNTTYTALTAKTGADYSQDYYDAFFSNIKLGSVVLDAVTFATTNVYITANTSLVFCNNTSEINVYLPASPSAGRIIYIMRSANGAVQVYAQGNNGIDMRGSSATSVGISSRGNILMFLYQGDVKYSGETRSGLWAYGWLNNN